MNRPGADGTRESGKIVLVEATPSSRGPEEQWGYDAAGHWSVRAVLKRGRRRNPRAQEARGSIASDLALALS